MKLLGWQCTAGILIKVIGVIGVTSATAVAVPVVSTLTTGSVSVSASELLGKRLHFDANGAADAFPVNSLDYILGDTIFGSLMFASANHAGTGHFGPGWNANMTTAPAALLSRAWAANGMPVSVDAGDFLLAT